MKKPNLSKFVRNVGSTIERNKPQILMGLGITGMLTTTYLAVKETPKALEIIEAKKKELQVDKLPVKEAVKATWKCYAPAAITGVASIGCLLGANSVHTKRTAAIATAYNVSRTALQEFKDATIDTVAPEVVKEIKEKVAKKEIEKAPDTNTVIVLGEEDFIVYDRFSGRYFKSNYNKIKAAQNTLNELLYIYDYVSLNTLYSELGQKDTTIGGNLGWQLNMDTRNITIDLTHGMTEDNRPCLVMDFDIQPMYGYDHFG